ncbi:MAG: hypothetical protein A2506_02935 [Elusimicrobia bacterium RIFOXYD12_FULL_66_9]|nr:MAG: hypothetical protein A2506_02935 [Elusimicrobia bacterium RIFOXYD12_FULL_66_9]
MARIPLRLPLLVGLALAACAAPTTERYREEVPPPNAVGERPPDVVAEPEPMPTTLPELLTGIEAAYRKGDYNRGLALVKKVYELKSADVTALDRVGSIYYVLGRYGEALTVWQQALPFEKSPRRRAELSRSITVARRTLGLPDVAPPQPGPPAAAVRPKPKKPARRAPDQKAIAALYSKGVKHYARGEFLQATTAFLRILELDPGNLRAAKALERLHLDGAESAR